MNHEMGVISSNHAKALANNKNNSSSILAIDSPTEKIVVEIAIFSEQRKMLLETQLLFFWKDSTNAYIMNNITKFMKEKNLSCSHEFYSIKSIQQLQRGSFSAFSVINHHHNPTAAIQNPNPEPDEKLKVTTSVVDGYQWTSINPTTGNKVSVVVWSFHERSPSSKAAPRYLLTPRSTSTSQVLSYFFIHIMNNNKDKRNAGGGVAVKRTITYHVYSRTAACLIGVAHQQNDEQNGVVFTRIYNPSSRFKLGDNAIGS